MRTRGFLAALALPLALATACGDDSSTVSDPSPTTSSSAAASQDATVKQPQCDDVWVAGKALPGGYQGCYEGTERVKASGRYCEFGKPLFTYDERFYAVRAGRIAEAKKPFAEDAGYQDVLAKCSG